jgi:hypothetical protein
VCGFEVSHYDRPYSSRLVGFERKSPMKLLLLVAATWYAWIATSEPGSRADQAARDDPLRPRHPNLQDDWQEQHLQYRPVPDRP